MPLGTFDHGAHLARKVCSGTCQQHAGTVLAVQFDAQAGRPARQMFEQTEDQLVEPVIAPPGPFEALADTQESVLTQLPSGALGY
ncbi:hypothetical protein D3C78_383920 [compost metagenome]